MAEENKESWHWHMPFDIETGKTKGNYDGGEDYGTLTADYLLQKMKEDASVVAITSATPTVLVLQRIRESRREDSLWM